MRTRILALLVVSLSGVTGICVSARAGLRPHAASITAEAPTDLAPARPANTLPSVVFIHGLDEQVNHRVGLSIAEELTGYQVQMLALSTTLAADFQWPGADYIVATGQRGCQIAMQNYRQKPLLCTLLTEFAFRHLYAEQNALSPVTALVIDQPIERQAQVARSLYPALSRFVTFSTAKTAQDLDEPDTSITYFQRDTNIPLASQLGDSLRYHDALIATADNDIYNSSTLSTVLLSAYGYRKPVIGFSRSYVKSGALITCFSTPAQIIRQVAERLDSGLMTSENAPVITYPRYFSVADNPSVARSLELIKALPVASDVTFSDGDFQP